LSAARNYLFSLEIIGIKLGLEQMRALMALLDHPDRAFPSIVIAGTNGKGSVTAMIERGLRAAGYRTGRYTSPHLVHLEERVVIDGEAVNADVLDLAADKIQMVSSRLPAPPSFFEATTAMALDIFRDARVDIAVLEVGLGGRLDATNVVTPIGVAITSIDIDHQQYLGDTLEAIAGEKAGVIKPGAFAVLAENPAPVRAVVDAAAAGQGVRCLYAPDGAVVNSHPMSDGRTELSLSTPARRYDVVMSLRGRHQIANAITAVRVLEAVDALAGFEVPAAAIGTALSDAVWPARLELLHWRGHDVLLDGAHNPAGARALAAYLADTYGRRLPIVVGAMRDKAVDEILAALAPAASAFLCTSAASSRAATPAELAAGALSSAPGVPVRIHDRPMDALTDAMSLGTPAVVAGSLYLCGEIRAEIS
jgi:dihydrofolate synthase/folylpolyglutamate synthase